MTITTSNTAGSIVQEALELLGVLGEGELYNAAQGTSMLKTLNSLCTAWQADGLNLFAIEHTELLVIPNVYIYTIDLAGNCNTIWTSNLRQITVDTPIVADTTDLIYPKESVDNISVGDAIHIFDSEENQWVTYNVIAVADTYFQVDAQIEYDLAQGLKLYISSGNKVKRPLLITNANFVTKGGSSIPCRSLSREEYYVLTKRDISGNPLQFYYDKKYPTANLYLYPVPTDAATYMSFAVQTQLDSPTLAEDVAFPPEWFTPLAYNLAFAASAKYGTPQFEYYRIREQAKHYYDMVRGFDQEEGTSLYFQPREPNA